MWQFFFITGFIRLTNPQNVFNYRHEPVGQSHDHQTNERKSDLLPARRNLLFGAGRGRDLEPAPDDKDRTDQERQAEEETDDLLDDILQFHIPERVGNTNIFRAGLPRRQTKYRAGQNRRNDSFWIHIFN